MATVVVHLQATNGKYDPAARSVAPFGDPQLVAPDHHQREFVLVGPRRSNSADMPAVAQDADPVTDL